MEEKDIRNGVRKVFLEVFGGDAESFNFEKKQEDFENWDSLAHMQLVSGVETAFGIQLEMEEIVEIQIPEGFVKLVEKKLSQKGRLKADSSLKASADAFLPSSAFQPEGD